MGLLHVAVNFGSLSRLKLDLRCTASKRKDHAPGMDSCVFAFLPVAF